jgi:hypothetical protein
MKSFKSKELKENFDKIALLNEAPKQAGESS